MTNLSSYQSPLSLYTSVGQNLNFTMKNKILIFLVGFLSLTATSQTINEEGLMGEWQVLNVEILQDIEKSEATDFLINGFKNTIFIFNGNMIFNWDFGKVTDPRLDELFEINGENWAMDEAQIFIGTKANGFSSMHIKLYEKEKETYFILPMMRLKVTKIKGHKRKRPKKSKKKSKYNGQVKFQYSEPVYIELNEEEVLPFTLIDQPPLGPQCKRNWEKDEQIKCTRDFIIGHVNRKFNTELAADKGVSGKIRIDVEFIIDKSGNPINAMATGGPDIMNQNAIDVIASLPKLRPGIHNGEKTYVSYKFPIVFMIVD